MIILYILGFYLLLNLFEYLAVNFIYMRYPGLFLDVILINKSSRNKLIKYIFDTYYIDENGDIVLQHDFLDVFDDNILPDDIKKRLND